VECWARQQARGEWTCWTAASTRAAGVFGLAFLQRQRKKALAPQESPYVHKLKKSYNSDLM